jgi:4-carboxymuconolactone decarboxylase
MPDKTELRDMTDAPHPWPQGYARDAAERLPMPAEATMTPAQRDAAEALINGPRKGVYGPFLPLLRSPVSAA